MITTKKSAIRSLEENAYYHGVVVALIADFRVWHPRQAHQWIKDTFGIDSTAELTTVEFEKLMDTVRNHVKVYWDMDIPLPHNYEG